MKFKLALTAATFAMGASAFAQTKWDLPAAYPASNFHTENLTQFAADVDKASGGKLKITVHANASLFKANEIKRAVQGGQAQLGEILLVNFENENPIYGVDGLPFLASSYASARKLADAQKPALDDNSERQRREARTTVIVAVEDAGARKASDSACGALNRRAFGGERTDRSRPAQLHEGRIRSRPAAADESP